MQSDRDYIDDFRRERPTHDFLPAERLPVESDRDGGNRHAFANRRAMTILSPGSARDNWQMSGYTPLALSPLQGRSDARTAFAVGDAAGLARYILGAISLVGWTMKLATTPR
jgi:hypothetical protein